MAEEVKKAEGEQGKGAGEGDSQKTVGEVIKEAIPGAGDGEGEGHEGEMVPLSALLDVKKDNKKMAKDLKKLQDLIDAGGSSKEDIADEVEALAKEFDVDPKFASRLLNMAEGRAEKKVGDTIKPILEQNEKLTRREKDDLINKAFTKHFDAAMETLPEYKEIADPEVIKTLSLVPSNANKTFAQLIESTYGKAIAGKRSIDTVKQTGGGKDTSPLDIDKARRDPAYFAEVMADPALKKEYNEKMLLPHNRRS